MNEKAKICKEKDYHTWSDSNPICDSLGETFRDIVLQVKCSVCGATAECNGDWDVPDDSEKEDDMTEEEQEEQDEYFEDENKQESD